MDIKRAKELLELLADGIDPITGEVLEADHVCNQAEIVRALHVAVGTLDKKAANQRKLPENAGKPWEKEDDEVLCRMFDAGSTKKDMCAYFKRTSGSIAARLVRLGKINSRIDFEIQDSSPKVEKW